MRTTTLLVNIAWAAALVVLLAIGYALSYAPIVRFTNARFDATDGDGLLFYKPVDWLIDSTPLRGPLVCWADFCGVRGEFVSASWYRYRHKQERWQDWEYVTTPEE